MMNKIEYKIPQKLTQRNTKEFLKSIDGVFKLSGKKIEGFNLDAKDTSEIDILGQLLLYKFLDFTVNKNCFLNPKTNLKYNYIIADKFKKYGFTNLVDSCFSPSSRDTFANNEQFIEKEGIYIAPMILRRASDESGIGNVNESKINQYYSYDINISKVILTCIGEISSNFQAHAQNDTRSIIVAQGNKEYFEIACADTGDGIITSLRPSLHIIGIKNKVDILRKSIDKNITSKPEEGHMGCGLWLVNELVTKNHGLLHLFSQGVYLTNRKGKIKCGESSYWQGTIIYLMIPLKKIIPLKEILHTINIPNITLTKQ